MLTWNRTIPLLNLMAVISMFAQSPPSSDRPWHSPDERQIVSEGNRFRQSAFRIESDKTYSLAELIDLAEAHNPETRVAWENARAQAAALGIARSELYPTLTPGELLAGTSDRRFETAWAMANAKEFRAVPRAA